MSRHSDNLQQQLLAASLADSVRWRAAVQYWMTCRASQLSSRAMVLCRFSGAPSVTYATHVQAAGQGRSCALLSLTWTPRL